MLTVRRATVDDVKSVVKMWKKLMKNQLELMGQCASQHCLDLRLKDDAGYIFENFLEGTILSKDGMVFVSEIDKKLVGYIIVLIQKNIPVFKLEKYGEIIDLYVEEEFRGRRISSKLMEKALRWCKRNNVKKVSLKVIPSNPAEKI